MTRAVPTSADEFIEQQLDERLLALEQALDSDVLCMVGALIDGLDDLIRILIENRKQREDSRPRLAVLLTTGGGFIEPVQRIVETFRHHYEHVVFVIPNYAFSAGTVLAMSGDDIYMDYYSRLGPIDPQVPSASGQLVPALGYLEQWNRLLKKAQAGKISLPEVQLMIEGFDQAELYKYEQARELSVALLKEWLVTYKFKNWTRTQTRNMIVTAAMKKRRAEAIARQLSDTEKWHSHGRGISMEVLRRDLNLLIDDLEATPTCYERLKEYDGLLSDYMRKYRDRSVLHTVGSYLRVA